MTMRDMKNPELVLCRGRQGRKIRAFHDKTLVNTNVFVDQTFKTGTEKIMFSVDFTNFQVP